MKLPTFIDETAAHPQTPQQAAYAQRRVLALLYKGGKHTTRQISIAAKVADPRKAISVLRRAGWRIDDEWLENAQSVRYKRYWLNMEGLK